MSAGSFFRRFFLLFLIFLTCFSRNCKSQQELQILLDVKTAFQRSNTKVLDSWSSDISLCIWTGILCNSAGSVTEIDLNSKNLAGILPLDSICRLPALEKLALGFNSLYGSVPPSLNNCSRLKYLDLAFNSLTGSLPDFSRLIDLKVLNLSDNGFTGPFPANSLRNLTNLVELRLGDNPFDRSDFPAEILNLRQLNWLYLSNCSLQGKIPAGIGKLRDLVNLELADNNFSGEIPAEMTNLTKLWQLELYDNYLIGAIPAGFGNLSNLAMFDASSNTLEGELTELRLLKNLVSLQLFLNQFSGGIPPEFGQFKSLVNLSLYGNKLSGPVPQQIGSWAEFNFIDISENRFTGPIPPDMCKKGTMKRLLVLQNLFSGEFPATYSNCSSLIRIRVSNNSLTGKVPAGIWSLPKVKMIDLSMNNFEGPVASGIGKAGSLSQLIIERNKLSGILPPEISQASLLVSIQAGFNQFSGEIPATIGDLHNLNNLDLQGNMLSGNIPDTLGSSVALNYINLAGNSLTGQIPANLASLPSLNYLNLSRNQLAGEIPAIFSSLRLSPLDLSYNRLTGKIPQGLALEAYNGSFAGNPGLCSQNIPFFRPCSSDSGHSHSRTLITCFLVGILILLASIAGFLLVKMKKNKEKELKIKKNKENEPQSFTDMDSWNVKSFRVLSFTEQDVLNSIKQENLIGKGGSGDVYRVDLGDGKHLAVKHIWNLARRSSTSFSSTNAMLKKTPAKSPEFDAEVTALSSIRHVNVVKLYCSITSEDSSLLVYEYLPNGSLWDRLHNCRKTELDWNLRYDIALGAAKGLEYLHHGYEKPVIHRDVKSSNILLDEFFKPRIADFGLAKILQPNASKDSTQVIAGTHGYIAPEYAYTCKVNEKSDVYSFGIVLMELVTGKRPMEPEFGENNDIVQWISGRVISKESLYDLVDARIPKDLRDDVIKVLRIGVLCTRRLPALRPSMRTVVQMLEDAEPSTFIYYTVKDDKKEGQGFHPKETKLNVSL